MTYIAVNERRKLIIAAAIEVIASEGLAGATTRRIADRAGAPLGALHYCFRDKNAILWAVVDEGATMLRECFADVDPSEGLEATIRNDIEALWKWYQENLGLQLALTEMGLLRIRAGGSPKRLYSIWDRFGRNIMLEHLREAERHDGRKPRIPIEEIVRFILHRFDGLTLEFAASQDKKACQRQVDLLSEAMVTLALGSSRPKRSSARARRRQPAKRRGLAAR